MKSSCKPHLAPDLPLTERATHSGIVPVEERKSTDVDKSTDHVSGGILPPLHDRSSYHAVPEAAGNLPTHSTARLGSGGHGAVRTTSVVVPLPDIPCIEKKHVDEELLKDCSDKSVTNSVPTQAPEAGNGMQSPHKRCIIFDEMRWVDETEVQG